MYLPFASGVLGSKSGLATYFRFSFRFFKKGSCQLSAKVCARSTGNRLGGLSLPRKSEVRLTYRPDMILDVYRGRKTRMQQQQQQPSLRKEILGLVCCRRHPSEPAESLGHLSDSPKLYKSLERLESTKLSQFRECFHLLRLKFGAKVSIIYVSSVL